MNKKIYFKIVTFVVMSVFILALGVGSFAAKPIEDSINWKHLLQCSYSFHPETYDSLYCYGSTVVGSEKRAYVKVELQQLQGTGWTTIETISDEDSLIAAKETTVPVDDGYTYRLKITHKAKTTAGTTIESYTHYSSIIAMHVPSGDEL